MIATRALVTAISFIILESRGIPLAAQCASQPPGLIAWWRAERDSSDSRGGFVTQAIGEPGYDDAWVGEALTLDGIDDGWVVDDPDGLLDITGDITVCLWAKRRRSGARSALVSKGAGYTVMADSPSAYLLTQSETDAFEAGFERADGSNVFLVSPAPMDADEFHHYAYVRQATRHEILVDGNVVASARFNGRPGSSRWLPLSIGAQKDDPLAPDQEYGAFFSGALDEIAIFDRALETHEIVGIVEAARRGMCGEPSAVRPFVRGDANTDGRIDVADAVFILNWLFLGGETSRCRAATNTNDDGAIDVADPLYLLNHLFLGGPTLAAPFPRCDASEATVDVIQGCSRSACPGL